MSTKMVSPAGTVSFPVVFTPSSMNEGDTPRWSVQIILKKGVILR